MKRLIYLLFLFLIALILPLGCTVDHSNTSGSSGTSNSLNVYNYSTYIDPEAIALFEQKFGVKVNYDTYESNEDLYAKLKSGNPGYDVIFPSDYMVTIMAKENLLQPLNLANIPNSKNIDNKFLNAPFDPENKYSLPYQWGTLGVGYNLKKTGGEINSWSAIFDPKYAGRVALIEDPRGILGAILLTLGYDPNSTNTSEIEQAKDYLIKNKATIAAFAPDTGQILLDQGEVDIAVEWSGDILQVMAENPDLRYAIPQEGSIVWIDNMAIPKDAPHQDLAEQFINFIFAPEISAKISNFIKFGSPNKIAVEQGLIADLNNPGIYPPPEVFEKLTYLRDVGEATQLYDDAWTEIKLGVGQ